MGERKREEGGEGGGERKERERDIDLFHPYTHPFHWLPPARAPVRDRTCHLGAQDAVPTEHPESPSYSFNLPVFTCHPQSLKGKKLHFSITLFLLSFS